ncbi:hypothetical protein [Tardiphaga sp. 862_B3_N1_1]|uniref:hypothetical protein n=1 Tax=Tardiphaga sp. 862_B3_N1_1 TaxID=3240763 RepID=UPI003F8BF3A9
MALPSSGPISLLQVANEFGGAVPHSISEYYGKAAGIPASGTISLSHFYGKANQFVLTISASSVNVNIRTLATNAGWDGARPLVVNITAPLINTLNLGTVAFAGGLTLNISAATRIGGTSGAPSTTAGVSGFNGGPALITRVPVTINNLGIISGGGGGGSAGSERWVTYRTSSHVTSDGGSGGAGAGFSNTSGLGYYSAPTNGSAATRATYSGATLGGESAPWAIGGSGGNGGAWGSAGVRGSFTTDYGGTYSGTGSDWGAAAPGNPGAAVDGNSYVTWQGLGTRLGGLIN